MIQNVVRGVFLQEGKLLVARATPDLVFLPGGHLEEGETAAACLARECLEEFGAQVSVGALLGVVEICYLDGEQTVHQIDLLLEATMPETEVSSREPHLTFFWVELDNLDALNLRPVASRAFIQGRNRGLLMAEWEA